MKLGQKDIKTLLYFFGFLFVVCGYQFVYVPQQEKKVELEMEKAELQNQVIQLQGHVMNQALYEEATVKYLAEIDAMIQQFPAKLEEEDNIMFMDHLEKELPVRISNVALGGELALYTGESKVLYKIPVTFDYTTTYNGLKQVVDHIHDEISRKTIETISLSYDTTTGKLIGNIVLNSFYMTGTEEEYEQPQLPGMNTGVSNILGTVEQKQE